MASPMGSSGHASATKTVTVFGGSGFVGRHLVQRLARRGWRVRVAVRRPERAKFLKPLGTVGQVVPWAASLTRPETIGPAVAGADAVVNLVGILFESGANSFSGVQGEGAGRIAEAAAAAGAGALVQVSAIGADPNSASAYARTKAQGEAEVRAAFPSSTILRPSIVIGPEDGFFNRFAGMARLSWVLPLVGGGETRFQPLAVGDLAEAICRALEHPAAAGQTYELGGPAIYSFRDLMELMLREIGRKHLLVPVPFALAEPLGSILGLLPNPQLTWDQVQLLKRDNVVGEGMPGFADLGIAPQAIEGLLPQYLQRYRPGGRFVPRLEA